MFSNCSCPPLPAIADILPLECGLSVGQIQKFILARRSKNAFTTMVSAGLIATWTPLLVAADNTKHQVTPFVESVVIPASEPILEGGDDNTTLDGNPIVVGSAQIRVTGMFAELSGDVLASIKKFNCENDLMIYFVNNAGKILGQNPSSTIFTGTPITSFFVGDAGNEGLNTRDKAPVGFNLRYGWRDKLVAITPTDFDARFDL